MDEMKICPVCGARLSGRSDKKFCSDLCRHEWHNRRGRQQRRATDRVNSALLKNLRILEELLATGRDSIDRQQLSYLQFNFNVHTGSRRRILRPPLFYCYNIQYYTDRRGIVRIRNTSL